MVLGERGVGAGGGGEMKDAISGRTSACWRLEDVATGRCFGRAGNLASSHVETGASSGGGEQEGFEGAGMDTSAPERGGKLKRADADRNIVMVRVIQEAMAEGLACRRIKLASSTADGGKKRWCRWTALWRKKMCWKIGDGRSSDGSRRNRAGIYCVGICSGRRLFDGRKNDRNGAGREYI